MDQAEYWRDPWGHSGQKQTWALPFSSGKMASGSSMSRQNHSCGQCPLTKTYGTPGTLRRAWPVGSIPLGGHLELRLKDDNWGPRVDRTGSTCLRHAPWNTELEGRWRLAGGPFS